MYEYVNYKIPSELEEKSLGLSCCDVGNIILQNYGFTSVKLRHYGNIEVTFSDELILLWMEQCTLIHQKLLDISLYLDACTNGVFILILNVRGESVQDINKSIKMIENNKARIGLNLDPIYTYEYKFFEAKVLKSKKEASKRMKYLRHV